MTELYRVNNFHVGSFLYRLWSPTVFPGNSSRIHGYLKCFEQLYKSFVTILNEVVFKSHLKANYFVLDIDEANVVIFLHVSTIFGMFV